MAKVRTFSRVFPSYHPKKGQETYFIEKFWQSLYNMGSIDNCLGNPLLEKEFENFCEPNYFITPKGHTIRAGKHFKAGDYFSPRVWSGKPYASKQIILSPDLKLPKVFDFKVTVDKKKVCQWFINDKLVAEYNEYNILLGQWQGKNVIKEIAKNDGLSLEDFLAWFKHPSNFDGQILCWTDHIKY